jgi:hypothetical protein
MMKTSHVALLAAILLRVTVAQQTPAPQKPEPPTATRPGVEKVVDDYIRLYTRPTLEQWKTLFHPAMIAVSPRDDGTIRVRTLDEFYGAQKSYFETGANISERLENIEIREGRRIAHVNADFIFVDEGKERRGKLGLHLAQEKESWKITAVIFSYD